MSCSYNPTPIHSHPRKNIILGRIFSLDFLQFKFLTFSKYFISLKDKLSSKLKEALLQTFAKSLGDFKN